MDKHGKPTSSEGAGHFVKTVHNGIGYADMQLLAEAYHLMKVMLGMDNLEIAQVLWNNNVSFSFTRILADQLVPVIFKGF